MENLNLVDEEEQELFERPIFNGVVEIGILNPYENDFIVFDGGKVGGKPIFLNPETILRIENLKCSICERIMQFFIQLYLPSENSHAFHRVLYIYICNNKNCLLNQSIKIFRSQLSRENSYYPKNWSDEMRGNLKQYDNKCKLCGNYGGYSCSKCHTVKYCSKDHQKEDWNLFHKDNCNTKDIEMEDEIYVEEKLDPSKYKLVEETDESKFQFSSSAKITKSDLKAAYGNLNRNLEEMSEEAVIFQERVEQNPNQVVRIYKHDNNAILWSTKTRPGLIPSCPVCNCERSFEVQIMPQLIYFLDIDENGIDYSSIVIYTCKNDCKINESDYIEEYGFVEVPE